MMTSESHLNTTAAISNTSLFWSNSSVDPAWPSPEPWQDGVMWIITLLTGILNTIVFIIVPQTPCLKNATGYCMLSLAATDVSLALYMFVRKCVLAAHGYPYLWQNMAWCSGERFVLSMLVICSITTLVLVSVDRWLKLAFPLRYNTLMTKTRCIAALVGIWVYSFGICLALLGMKEHPYIPSVFMCLPLRKAKTGIIHLFLMYWGPFLILAAVYVTIFHIVRRRSHRLRNLSPSNPASKSALAANQDLRVIKMIFIMTAGFYIAWSPYMVIMTMGRMIVGDSLYPPSDFLSAWLGASNSFWNPVLYFPLHRSYRQTFLRLCSQYCQLVKSRRDSEK